MITRFCFVPLSSRYQDCLVNMVSGAGYWIRLLFPVDGRLHGFYLDFILLG